MNEDLQKKLINDLLIESFEGLDNFEEHLLALEKGGADQETMNCIFRVIHTIKGTAGCIGLGRIESVAHVGENLLDKLRSNEIASSPAIVSALLKLSDALRQMLNSLESTGSEGDADYTQLTDLLTSLLSGGNEGETTAQPAAESTSAPVTETAPEPAAEENQTWGLFVDDEPAGEDSPAASPAAATAPVTPAVEAAAPAPDAGTTPPAAGAQHKSVADSAIRVSVDLLDKLMNLVGELVLARNQILQHSTTAEDATLGNASQRLNLITTELQESVMKTRMQPIGNVWSKFPRIVRDLSSELGKHVELIMDGQETELDRTIIEGIKDPLTHLIRNAVDHGIEPPDVRKSHGKPEKGTLILRAYHEGGQVNIEITDDGGGINVARVKDRAIGKGILSADQASRMTDREAFGLIFEPGFSTAEKVTNVSGRGVGMDVVKTNIEKIGGSVDVHSEADKSTSIKIKIPLTLAIIPALVITSGEERFAIPQVSLVELVRLEAEQAKSGIESIYGAPVYRLRGNLLPLVYLNDQLQLGARDGEGDESVNIVVLQADGRQIGVVVDQVNDTEEIVVKPLGKQLKGLSFFAGATIMGDGRVALILDTLGLAQHARVVSEVRDRALMDEKTGAGSTDEDGRTLLLFDNGEASRMAIPLDMVARLEEIPRERVERTGGEEVVQYRGQIMPLVRVSSHVAGAGAEDPASDPLQVVVYNSDGKSVGLVVGRINDIVKQSLAVQRSVSRPGILGSAVVQDRVTDLLDVEGIVRSVEGGFAN